VLTDRAVASRGSWSRASRRFLDSSLLQRRHVDARSAGDILQRQPALHAQFAEAAADPKVDAFLVFCLHGKRALALGGGAGKLVDMGYD
jgi:hypothetical protein